MTIVNAAKSPSRWNLFVMTIIVKPTKKVGMMLTGGASEEKIWKETIGAESASLKRFRIAA
jgi:hypothetical protein